MMVPGTLENAAFCAKEELPIKVMHKMVRSKFTLFIGSIEVKLNAKSVFSPD